MSFFDKAKNFVGVGTVELQFECPSTFSRQQKTFDGILHIIGLSDQELKKVEVMLIKYDDEVDREYRSRDERLPGERILGRDLLCNQLVPIKKGETLSAQFSIPYTLEWSLAGELSAQDGFLGTVGRVKEMLDQGIFPDYKVIAEVNVKSAAIDPIMSKSLRLE